MKLKPQMMINNNQYIKNFFLFLKEKEKRDLSATIKFILFPDKLTNEDLKFIKYEINSIRRANMFNALIKENDLFFMVQEFDTIVPSLAVAYIFNKNGAGYYTVFIDIDGNKSVKGANFSDLLNLIKMSFMNKVTPYEETLMPYFNTIQSEYTYFDIDIVDDLIISYKTKCKIDNDPRPVSFYCPICVNEIGYPNPYFVPKNEEQERILNYTIDYLNKIEDKKKNAEKR